MNEQAQHVIQVQEFPHYCGGYEIAVSCVCGYEGLEMEIGPHCADRDERHETLDAVHTPLLDAWYTQQQQSAEEPAEGTQANMSQYNGNLSIVQLLEGPNDGPSNATYTASAMQAYLQEHPGASDDAVLWAGAADMATDGELPDWAPEVLAHVRHTEVGNPPR